MEKNSPLGFEISRTVNPQPFSGVLDFVAFHACLHADCAMVSIPKVLFYQRDTRRMTTTKTAAVTVY